MKITFDLDNYTWEKTRDRQITIKDIEVFEVLVDEMLDDSFQQAQIGRKLIPLES